MKLGTHAEEELLAPPLVLPHDKRYPDYQLSLFCTVSGSFPRLHSTHVYLLVNILVIKFREFFHETRSACDRDPPKHLE